MEGNSSLRESFSMPGIGKQRINVLQIQFFAHLTTIKVISVESMCTLLRSFVAVLDEFGVSSGRAKRAAQCAGEGLLMVGDFFPKRSCFS